MPRKLKSQEADVAVLEPEQEAQPTAEAALEYKPWRGDREELEAPKIGKDGRVIKSGRPLFYIERNKLMAVYRGGGGISRKLWAMLKTITPRHENDVRALEYNRKLKEFRMKLKKAGIQGA